MTRSLLVRVRSTPACPFSGSFHLHLTGYRDISGSDINSTIDRSATHGGTPVVRLGALVLLLLWVLGLVTGHTMGGFVHVLLVLALILGMISLVHGKNP